MNMYRRIICAIYHEFSPRFDSLTKGNSRWATYYGNRRAGNHPISYQSQVTTRKRPIRLNTARKC